MTKKRTRANFVELALTDTSIDNFGKCVYDINKLKDKTEKYIEGQRELLDFQNKVNFFQFHPSYVLKLALTTQSSRNTTYDYFAFYSMLKRAKNSKLTYQNAKELYHVFEHNASSPFVKAIHRLIHNLGKYFFIISDVPFADCDLNIFDIYKDNPEFYTAEISDLQGLGFELKIPNLKRRNKDSKPYLIITLSNDALAYDLYLQFKGKAYPVVILN